MIFRGVAGDQDLPDGADALELELRLGQLEGLVLLLGVRLRV